LTQFKLMLKTRLSKIHETQASLCIFDANETYSRVEKREKSSGNAFNEAIQ
jgi:hypothetical protein